MSEDQFALLKISSPFEKLVVSDNRKGYKTAQFVTATLTINVNKMDELDGCKCLVAFSEEVEGCDVKIQESIGQRIKNMFNG